jgi:hypothetical protein
MANPKLVTPIGTLLYGSGLQEASDFKGNGVMKFKAKVVLTGAAAQEFFEELTTITQDHAGVDPDKLQHPIAEWDESRDKLTVRLSTKATGKTKDGEEFSRRPVFYEALEDGTMAPCERVNNNEIKLFNGTRGQVAINAYCWKTAAGTGVTLQPTAVRLTEIVEFKEMLPTEEYHASLFDGKVGENAKAAPDTGEEF